MQVIVKPSKLNGVLKVPSSKSGMQRVCAAALLYKGTCIVNNIGHAADDKVAIDVIQQMGATINLKSETSIEIISDGNINTVGNIHCGESGLSTRLFTIIAALSPNEITITGSGSLVNRSMIPFEELFSQLGVDITNFGGRLPITIKGPMQVRSIKIDGSFSSQFLSGLLISYAFNAKEKVTINVANLISRPYIDMTLEVLEQFGLSVINKEYEEFTIVPVVSNGNTIDIDIEGDWSSASFWLIAAAINGKVKLTGLDRRSTQADKAVLSVLEHSGVNCIIGDGIIEVESLNDRPNCFSFDATNAPDLFPILSIYAALCNGESEIKGLHRLSQKESDRTVSIKSMLDAFGVKHTTKEDSLLIIGQEALQAATIDSYNDHRIAMAAAIGALNAAGVCTINHAEAVKKSYSNFYEDLQALGGGCSLDIESSK